MKREIASTMTLTLIALAVLGCSHIPHTVPGIDETRTPESYGHTLWAYYHLCLDPSGPSVDVVEARLVMKHFNVKPYLIPPACADCVDVQVTGPYQDHILPLNITLKNPTDFTGYDIRGILLSDDPGATLDNPDNYTDLFDDGGEVNINPFRAFAKTSPNRSFGPGESFQEGYDIYLSKFNKVLLLDYAIDASFPSRAKEPYEISPPQVDGEIDNYGKNEVDITVEVYAAGDDVDEVWFDLSSMGFTEEFALAQITDTTWKLTFQNTNQVHIGQYQGLCRASTTSSNKFLYSYFKLIVVVGVRSLQDDVQPIFNLYCTDCHQEPMPPVSLDLSEGNAYSNTVDVDSVQSSLKRINPGDIFSSYVFGKIEGLHEDFPFFGSGERMPLNGPPYLNPDEVQILVEWITQGALDN